MVLLLRGGASALDALEDIELFIAHMPACPAALRLDLARLENAEKGLYGLLGKCLSLLTVGLDDFVDGKRPAGHAEHIFDLKQKECAEVVKAFLGNGFFHHESIFVERCEGFLAANQRIAVALAVVVFQKPRGVRVKLAVVRGITNEG